MTINSFKGDYAFLSNFYEVDVNYDGITYKNSEAAFQAAKTLDNVERMKFSQLNPSQAKALGRKVRLRRDWEQVKIQVMHDVCLCKFTQHEDLKKKLIDTGDAYLEEGNTWGDRCWGTVNGIGENNLGKVLMQLREELKN